MSNNFEAVDLDEYLVRVSKKLESLEKQNVLNADSSDSQYDNNFGLLNFVYLPGGNDNENTVGGGGDSGGSGDSDVSPKNYVAKLRMQHSYFLSTILNFRSTAHFCCDICLILTSMVFFFGALSTMVQKGRLDNYHVIYQPEDNTA